MVKREIYTYYTNIFTLEECQSRLQDALKSENYRGEGYRGRVDSKSHSFRLWQKTPFIRNSFSRKFYGKLTENGQGTVIRGYFKINTIVSVFMVFWYCGLIDMCLSVLANNLLSFLTMLPIAVLMGLMGLAVVFIGLKMSASHERNVLSFLESSLLVSKVNK